MLLNWHFHLWHQMQRLCIKNCSMNKCKDLKKKQEMTTNKKNFVHYEQSNVLQNGDCPCLSRSISWSLYNTLLGFMGLVTCTSNRTVKLNSCTDPAFQKKCREGYISSQQAYLRLWGYCRDVEKKLTKQVVTFTSWITFHSVIAKTAMNKAVKLVGWITVDTFTKNGLLKQGCRGGGMYLKFKIAHTHRH